uniref:Uncharacterized protein n=1 Tax=Ralstonia solanacearum TaxID=305 RepID=A0A0S4WSQ0_RALSL|nr:protein of unknown function [Ralstonia solanacearum]
MAGTQNYPPPVAATHTTDLYSNPIQVLSTSTTNQMTAPLRPTPSPNTHHINHDTHRTQHDSTSNRLPRPIKARF